MQTENSQNEILRDDNPKTNPYLLSHIKQEEEFFSAFKSSQLHHSWLITGPNGIGKASLAYRIARYIFTLTATDHLKNLNINIDVSAPIVDNSFEYEEEEGDDSENMGFFNDDMDGDSQVISSGTSNQVAKSESLEEKDKSPLKLSPSHPVFERLTAGGLTDLIVIEREYNETTKKLKTEISVEQIRALKEFFSKTSSEGGYRVAIIDSVDEMNPNGRNALLKILEEAPEKSLLLLICHNINGLLPTIKSRCRILKLSPISNDNMKVLLQHHLPNVDEKSRNTLLNISGGSIGMALNIYKNNGLELQSRILKIIPEIFNKKNASVLDIANMVANEEMFKIFEHIIINFIENAIKYKSGIVAEGIEAEEKLALQTITSYYTNVKALFSIREQVLKHFQLYPVLNLDITALVISTFERMKNVH